MMNIRLRWGIFVRFICKIIFTCTRVLVRRMHTFIYELIAHLQAYVYLKKNVHTFMYYFILNLQILHLYIFFYIDSTHVKHMYLYLMYVLYILYTVYTHFFYKKP